VINKIGVAIAVTAALAAAVFASAASAQSDNNWPSRAEGHHYRSNYRGQRLYNSAPETQSSPYDVNATGAGSLGYNQHNEVKN